MENQCGSCKYFEQGKTKSFCGNPKQTNKDLIDYAYWCFSCNLYTKGIAQSRIDWNLKWLKAEKKLNKLLSEKWLEAEKKLNKLLSKVNKSE